MARCSSLVLAALAAAACGPAPEGWSAISSRAIYGDDDRRDWFELEDELQALARSSVVSIFGSALDESDPGDVRVRADSVGHALGLCKEERFWDDPAAAECSGTLIANDLVLTAGHCFKREKVGPARRSPAEVCKTRRFVFGYYHEGPSTLHRITSEDVFRCAELLVHRDDLNETDPEDARAGVVLDFSIVRLDRSAAPRFRPVTLRTPPPVTGEPLIVLGFPSGMPLKAAVNGVITAVRPQGDYANGTTDTFAGNSGSGVFDATTHEQVGVLVAGQRDYVKAGACSVTSRCADTGCDGKTERIHQIAPILTRYCQRADARAEVCRPRPHHRLWKQ